MKKHSRKLAFCLSLILFFTGIPFSTGSVVNASQIEAEGESCTVTVKAFAEEQVLDNPEITFIDSSGTVIQNTSGSTVEVGAGQYRYRISDGGWNCVEGKIDVTGDETLQVSLPTGEWFSNIEIRDGEQKSFSADIKKERHEAQFWIEDIVGEDGIYLYAEQGQVPDSSKTKLFACYEGLDGQDKSEKIHSWNSSSNTLSACINEGMTGREFWLEAHYEVDGYTQIQTYDMEIVRVPTLQALKVREGSEDGNSILSGFAPDMTEYNLVTNADVVYVEGVAQGTDGYVVSGNGVVETKKDGTVECNIFVSHTNGMSQKYVLNITNTKAVTVNCTVAENTTLLIENENGTEIKPDSVSMNSYCYSLIPGETYTYTTTCDEYFHATAKFQAEENMTLTVAQPEMVHGLQDFAMYDSSNVSIRDSYFCENVFSPLLHNYTYIVSDENSYAAVQATPVDGYKVMALYKKQSAMDSLHGTFCETEVTTVVDHTAKATTLSQVLASCGYDQNLTLRLLKEENGITWYQDYEIQMVRSLHLDTLELKRVSDSLPLLDEEGNVVDFDSENSVYYARISKQTECVKLNGTFVNEKNTTDICGGYYVEVDGVRHDSMEGIEIPLNSEDEQLVQIVVKHINDKSISKSYQIFIQKQEAMYVRFETTPQDAIVFVWNPLTKTRVYAEEDGSYALFPENSYDYTITANGYVGYQVKDFVPSENYQRISVVLKKADINQKLKTNIEAQWSSFRDTPDNNCITDVKTPTQSEKSTLYWATKLGSGYGNKATGCPILVDGYLYTYAGKEIYKVDTITGQVVATGAMAEASSYAINPPTYAEGMIFVGLKDGRVQAFCADTLESLWIYEDEVGGQPNCPITYHDGYIYTGFWLGENKEANYVCLSVTDEDPSQNLEKKLPSWIHQSMGGFYWAGAYVCDDYMLVGTDDGMSGYTTGYGHVISLDPKSGEILADLQLPYVGDVRCSIILYDDKYYFTSKGGYFYELSVKEDGTFTEEPLRYMKLENGSNDDKNPGMSTSTPTIYNGRAYVGVSGISQFGAYSGHNITVLDLNAWEIAYCVPTQGYPQTSGLLTTAYEEKEQEVYIYFFDNYTPGKLRMISDKPGQKETASITVEEYTQGGMTKTSNTAQVLFTPSGDHAQYALCSPIVDSYGTIYFKNDSAYLMAVGSNITNIKVTKQPEKISYKVGEVFEPKGMEVIATYSNGMTRDITKYVTYSKKPLTTADTDFTIEFSYVLYQDNNGTCGQECEKPLTAIQLHISTDKSNDGNSSGEKDKNTGKKTLIEIPGKAATLLEDGNITYFQDKNTKKLYADANGKQEIEQEATIIYRPVHMQLSKTVCSYNGKTQKPKVTIKDSNGKALTEGKDYTLSYTKGCKKVGRYSITITYQGNYSGSKTLYFYINPPKTSIKKIKAGSKKATITFKKAAQVSGYEIQYATNKKFKKAVKITVKSNSGTKKSIGKLKGKKKYFFRIRTYKTVKVDGKSKKLYSEWSGTKSVTIKK